MFGARNSHDGVASQLTRSLQSRSDSLDEGGWRRKKGIIWALNFERKHRCVAGVRELKHPYGLPFYGVRHY